MNILSRAKRGPDRRTGVGTRAPHFKMLVKYRGIAVIFRLAGDSIKRSGRNLARKSVYTMGKLLHAKFGPDRRRGKVATEAHKL